MSTVPEESDVTQLRVTIMGGTRYPVNVVPGSDYNGL